MPDDPWTLETYSHNVPNDPMTFPTLEAALEHAIRCVEYNVSFPTRLLRPDGTVYAENHQIDAPWGRLYKEVTGKNHELWPVPLDHSRRFRGWVSVHKVPKALTGTVVYGSEQFERFDPYTEFGSLSLDVETDFAGWELAQGDDPILFQGGLFKPRGFSIAGNSDYAVLTISLRGIAKMPAVIR